MKKFSLIFMMILVLGLTACGKTTAKQETKQETSAEAESSTETEMKNYENAVKIQLSNSEILVDSEQISENTEDAVYKANDIIFYLEDQGIEYGEGTSEDEHSQIEADDHTVVHITKAGTYEISGILEAGQIFVDLGEDAKKDPEAVVTLILNNADITCTVAPAILFYNVYECAEDVEEEEAVMDVDTTAAGANLVLADGSTNKVYGSYIAKIYESCELSEDGTEVVDSKKLHKYDGALYSKMSMNVFGDTGILEINAENEGLDTEKHLTIHGGNIRIKSGNDAINVNEDNISVFTLNNGTVDIEITGTTGEGDGIDSNGWLIINGGTLNAYSCAISGDAGIDADKGIYINGGTVVATGNMNAELAGGKQVSVSFNSKEKLEGRKTYKVKDEDGNVVMEILPVNTFSVLVVSSAELTEDGNYSLWLDDTKIAEGTKAAMGMGGPGMGGPAMGGDKKPDGEMPHGGRPEGMEPPEKPDRQKK